MRVRAEETEETGQKIITQKVLTRILTLVCDYGNRDVLDYLRGIGHNLSF